MFSSGGQTIVDAFRAMYWTARKDPGAIPHLIGAVLRIVPNYLRIRSWLKAGRGSALIIVKIEHLGDVVAAEPIGRYARKSDPGRPILWIVDARYSELVSSFTSVDLAFSVRCVSDWIFLSHLIEGLVVWNLHIDGHCCPRCQIPLPGNTRSGLTFSNYYHAGNLTEVQSLLADLPRIRDKPWLPVRDSARIRVQRLLPAGRYFVVHCKSNHADRDWTSAGWRALVDRLVDQYGVSVVEVGLEPVAVPAPDFQRRSLCGRLRISETVEAIRGAALFIGIDSGPAHLANGVETPAVILLGEYRGFIGHMPFSGGYANGESAEIVRADGPVSAISVDLVMAAVDRRVAQIIVSNP